MISQNHPKIIFLQEIWLSYHEAELLKQEYPLYNFQISTPDMFDSNEDKILTSGHTWHGVAVGWHDDLNADVESIPTNNTRFAGIRIALKTGSILSISLYAPTSGKDDEFLECITDLTEYILCNISEGDRLLIGTDSNCSRKSTSRRQHCWHAFCDAFSLLVHSTESPTFHHHNGSSETCIDFFLSSKELKLHNLKQICTLESPLNLSSHDLLISSLKVPQIEKHDPKFAHTYSEFITERIIWDNNKVPEYQELASKALSEAAEFWSAPEATPLLCSLVPSLLVKCAKLVFNTKPPGKLKKMLKSKTIRQAEQLLTREHRKWKKAGKPVSKTNTFKIKYSQARSKLQHCIRNENYLKNIKNNIELMHANISDKNKVYSKMKSLRGSASRSFTSKLITPVGTFHGDDVLEGLAADAEHLGKPNDDLPSYDNHFYRLCKLDNLYIFELKDSTHIKIPPMTIEDLKHILYKKMKLRKSCDIYSLTVEHLRECGTQAQKIILKIINKIIDDISILTCPELKLGLGSSVYKGKKKPIADSRSYRRITVTPQIGAILDRYIEPFAESIFRLVQSPDQLGFTAGMSYLMASVVRGECQRWARDNGLTCFGVSLDGEAAFPSVEREIQIRELYSAGERGEILKYSRNTYKNTECHIKLNGKISRRFKEHKGNRQGHVRASGHYKAYVNPCLTALNDSNLGFQIGPICVTSVCIADDVYVLSGSKSSLQGALNIVNHYARRHRVTFNADKTKLVVTGSVIDMNYYKDTKPWTLNNENISVVENNDHLGLIVSGKSEEQKNVDANVLQCRNSLFAMLGPAYAFKCLLSPTVQTHLWRTYNLPVLTSGLSALPIRPVNIRTLSSFHNKILRGFLKLSSHSPIPSLYFLLGELPIEARVHASVFSLFYSIWSNPDTTAYQIVHYLLMMTDDSSTTWTAHVRILAKKYGTPDPLYLLENINLLSKEHWKTMINTKITIFHEKELRSLALNNSKMRFLNVQATGLSGHPHPALQNLLTTRDVLKLRAHLKFLCCDLLTGEQLGREHGADPRCKLCSAPVETTEHILADCRPLHPIRERLLPELLNTVLAVAPNCQLLAHPYSAHLTQFILDCTSLNLPNGFRLSPQNPDTNKIFRISRDWCYLFMKERTRLMKARTEQ